MTRIIIARLAGICLTMALMFGVLAAVEQPSEAQITVRCWREYCVKDPQTGRDVCAKEEIACPAQT